MQKILAVVALLCGVPGVDAFPANDAIYCSESFGKPAQLALSETARMDLAEGDNPEIVIDAPQKLTLTVGGRTEVFTFHEPNEGGAVLVFSPEFDGPSETGGADPYLAEAKIGETNVIIFADRVFWPCELRS